MSLRNCVHPQIRESEISLSRISPFERAYELNYDENDNDTHGSDRETP